MGLGCSIQPYGIICCMPERSPDRFSDLAFLRGGGEMGARMRGLDSVSYTHLTLPTILRV